MPILAVGTDAYGQYFLSHHFGPVIQEAGADLIIAAHTHRHLWLAPLLSGFTFPMLINGNTNYVKLEATPQTLSIRVISDKEETILSKELKRR
jgi:hypothetical protein